LSRGRSISRGKIADRPCRASLREISDAVIVAHRSFEFLPLSDQFVEKFIDQQVQQIEELSCAAEQDGEDRRLVKELEKAKKRLQAKLRKRANRESKDETLTFEELGIDYLFVDEADLLLSGVGCSKGAMNGVIAVISAVKSSIECSAFSRPIFSAIRGLSLSVVAALSRLF
jgi:N12 class adenine-specific DNA methylase